MWNNKWCDSSAFAPWMFVNTPVVCMFDGAVRRFLCLVVACVLWPQAAQAEWMGALWDDPVVGPQWRQTRLSDVVFPGTHDSGTYNLNGAEFPIGDELAAEDLALAGAMELASTFGFAEAVAEAQGTDIRQQLDDGVRALDIRTYYDVAENRVHITHTFKGPPLTEILADLAAFVSDPANAREIIVLQFSYASADVARVRFPGLNEAVYRQIFDYPVPSGGTLGDRFIPWDVPGGLRRWQMTLFGTTALSDPTVEQALATGGQIIFTGPRRRFQANGDDHSEDVYAKMWESPSREADFYGALSSGVYPSWFEMNTEGRALELMERVAAERPVLTLEDGAAAPSSHRYLSPIGLHSGLNTFDLTTFLVLGNPVFLRDYAAQLNPEVIPQLAALPRDQVNIVELDYYKSWMTPWFVALNRGVVHIETGPFDGAGSSTTIFAERTDEGDADGDPDFYPMYISGRLGSDFYSSFGLSFRLQFETEIAYNPDFGGGPDVSVEDQRFVSYQMTEAAGGWEHNRFAEVRSTRPEHLFIGFAEYDTTSGDDYVTISPFYGRWLYHIDLRSQVNAATGSAGAPVDTGLIISDGNVAWADNQGEHAAAFAFQHRLCEWGVNCPEDDFQVVESFPFLFVAEGSTLALDPYGHDSVYSSSVAGLYWDTAPDRVPRRYTTPSALASFDATGVAPGVYEISLAIIRTATDVTDVLDSQEYIVFVCSDWDRDGLFDGSGFCPNNDDDDDNDSVRDVDDVCAYFDDRLDVDADGVPDGCDLCDGDDAAGDSDGDGVCNDLDACPGADDTLDADADGVPNGCDLCDGDDATGDNDSDGVCDDLDACVGDDAFRDNDADGVCDDLDACPGADDTLDTDADSVPDGCDQCVGNDATGDSDGDSVCDDLDACSGADDTLDTDADGVPDSCDGCLGDDATGDNDGDGVCDDFDACLGADDALDADADGVPDGCDQCVGDDALGDRDSDGVCGIEDGWVCEPTSSENPDDLPWVCTTICGDGILAGDETCDDLNVDAGDGCNDVCTIEDGWSCSEEPSMCEEGLVCGDGRLGAEEGCDDGNTDTNDGCSDVCQVEDDWECELVEGASVCDFIDEDGDGVTDADDNCVSVADANQSDFDEDGVGDVCDNCPNDANPDQRDTNEDGVGDDCSENEVPEDAGGGTSDAGFEDTSTDAGVDSSFDITPDSTSDAETDTTDPNSPISNGTEGGCSAAPANNGPSQLVFGLFIALGALFMRRRASCIRTPCP